MRLASRAQKERKATFPNRQLLHGVTELICWTSRRLLTFHSRKNTNRLLMLPSGQ